jgi:uncharacterized protein YbaR (Trm112 family)
MDVPIELLRCPLTGQTVTLAPENLIRDLQARQQSGALRTRGGEFAEPFDGGLLTADGAWLYPIRSGIPVMLAGEAIAAAER